MGYCIDDEFDNDGERNGMIHKAPLDVPVLLDAMDEQQMIVGSLQVRCHILGSLEAYDTQSGDTEVVRGSCLNRVLSEQVTSTNTMKVF